ncbi:MAG: hypothetical protein MHPSP_002512 [Paramarteilia canceri]
MTEQQIVEENFSFDDLKCLNSQNFKAKFMKIIYCPDDNQFCLLISLAAKANCHLKFKNKVSEKKFVIASEILKLSFSDKLDNISQMKHLTVKNKSITNCSESVQKIAFSFHDFTVTITDKNLSPLHTFSTEQKLPIMSIALLDESDSAFSLYLTDLSGNINEYFCYKQTPNRFAVSMIVILAALTLVFSMFIVLKYNY